MQCHNKKFDIFLFLDFCHPSTEYCDKLYKFISDNLEFMMEKINDNPHDDYWQQVYIFFLIFFGSRVNTTHICTVKHGTLILDTH